MTQTGLTITQRYETGRWCVIWQSGNHNGMIFDTLDEAVEFVVLSMRVFSDWAEGE